MQSLAMFDGAMLQEIGTDDLIELGLADELAEFLHGEVKKL